MVSLPFVVSYCQISVAVGGLVILLGLSSFVVAGANLQKAVVPYCVASLLVLIVQLACFDMTQVISACMGTCCCTYVHTRGGVQSSQPSAICVLFLLMSDAQRIRQERGAADISVHSSASCRLGC